MSTLQDSPANLEMARLLRPTRTVTEEKFKKMVSLHSRLDNIRPPSPREATSPPMARNTAIGRAGSKGSKGGKGGSPLARVLDEGRARSMSSPFPAGSPRIVLDAIPEEA